MLIVNQDSVEVHRAEIVLAPGASLSLFVLNGATDYGRVEVDVTVRDGAHFALHAANIAGGKATQEIVTVVRHEEPNGTSTRSCAACSAASRPAPTSARSRSRGMRRRSTASSR